MSDDKQNESGCRAECGYLLDLAGRLAASMRDADTRLQSWHEEMYALQASPECETLAGECSLDQLSLRLRTEWLRYANHCSSKYMKSPPVFQRPQLPSGSFVATPYDRWTEPVALESRADSYHPSPAGWHADHVMFNTGMGAMTCLLMILRTMFQPGPANLLRLHGLGGYFEIMDLITASNDNTFQTGIFDNQQQLFESVAHGSSQVIYIEPVSCRYNLEVFDLEGFLKAWAQRPAGIPTIIIFDTTLTGNLFPLQEVLERTVPTRPALVLQLSSTLKLDQEGLEFSNAGLLSAYSMQAESTNDMSFRLRRFRSAMGLGLGVDQIAALDYPGYLDTDISNCHSKQVFESNALVAPLLETGDDLLFDSASHPSLTNTPDSPPWSVAPFIYLRLRKGSDKEDLQLLNFVFTEEARQRGLPISAGSSFGFRGHRCELGGIRDTPGYETIRLAMGSRRGPCIPATVELMNDLSRIRTFENMRDRYPQLVDQARAAAEQKKKHYRRN